MSLCDCELSGSANTPKPSAVSGDAQIVDPFCDPSKPKRIAFEKVALAYVLIRNHIKKTACEERGARFAMLQLSEEQRKKGCVSASAGNHALAMCYHGLQLGISVTVVMPAIAPLMKIQKCKELKGNVIVQGANMVEAKNIAMKLAQENGSLYINGYDHPDILAGQGTIGIDILEQIPDVDAVVVPVGGGGLITGIALAVKSLKPSVKVIGVESNCCPGFTNALKAGKPILTECKPSMADGLAVPLVGCNSVETAKHYVDRMILVKEEDIAVSILRLVEMEKFVVEGAGATSVAAVLSGQMDEFIGKNVVLVLSGGNIDSTVLHRAIERGLAADGRLIKIYVKISDRPGGLAELAGIVGSTGAVIKRISQERAWLKMDVFSVEVKVVLETRDYEHVQEIRKTILARYKDARIEHVEFPASSAINQRFKPSY